ncbi:MAG: prolyl oligopeptidase family serine peptidase [Pseudomonadales bacterium]|jgi:predicted peptidase|tara:strand:- start:884 stop:1531 length:648 start_codon:yes stop_codon:yes gene_type:complete
MKQSDHRLKTKVKIDVSLPYRTYLPKRYSEKGAGRPLLLFLHGAGERGSDLTALTSTALPKQIEAGELDLPFVTVCPQCPEGTWWDELALVALLDKAVADYNIDESRIYLTGLSMGGRGTWQLANVVADRLAAIAPICAPFMFVNPAPFKRLPIWAFHGVMDSVVPVTESVRMVRMLRQAGCKVEFTTYANADHDSWTETYKNPALYEWMLSHRR